MLLATSNSKARSSSYSWSSPTSQRQLDHMWATLTDAAPNFTAFSGVVWCLWQTLGHHKLRAQNWWTILGNGLAGLGGCLGRGIARWLYPLALFCFSSPSFLRTCLKERRGVGREEAHGFVGVDGRERVSISTQLMWPRSWSWSWTMLPSERG